jgi:tRNA(Ile)-lysidine synthase
MVPEPALIERFRRDLDELVEADARVGIAVSGGPDSLALLLLAAAARPRLVEAATVDHALRPESRAEAEMVAGICERLRVPHNILTAEWEKLPDSQLQAAASFKRYQLLGGWARERSIPAVATAHHLDDQAETYLMRLNRGAGVTGLAGIRASRPLDEGVSVIRPLLRWRRSELKDICEQAGLSPIADPSNADPRFERTHARRLLAASDWLDPTQIAQSADHLNDADEALQSASDRLIAERIMREGEDILVDGRDLPPELQRRLLIAAHEFAGGKALRGPDLKRAIRSLYGGGTATLGGLKMIGEPVWRLQTAPPRRAVKPKSQANKRLRSGSEPYSTCG